MASRFHRVAKVPCVMSPARKAAPGAGAWLSRFLPSFKETAPPRTSDRTTAARAPDRQHPHGKTRLPQTTADARAEGGDKRAWAFTSPERERRVQVTRRS